MLQVILLFYICFASGHFLKRSVNFLNRNMKPNVMLLIEYLISLSEDESVEVREEAEKALNTINASYMQSENMRPLVELLEETFYGLLTKLPRIIRRSGTIFIFRYLIACMVCF